MNDHQKNHATSQDDNTKSTPSKNSKHIKIKLWHFILVILGIILLTSIITVVSTILISHQKSGLNKEQRANLKKIEYVYQTLNKDYYKKQSSDKLTQSAIDGMVKELKDPYSEYMTAEETKQFNEGVSGDFVGIGAEMQKKNEQISV
ncbi:MAG: serine protease, partial [Staphylococcus epidermidis]|nr:serine protease [Staphylococcus epidermidis]